MLPCNMIRSRQPRPATSPRTLPLSPFHDTYSPILLSPLTTSRSALPPNSTHPTQLDTPVPPQPLCFQSYPHAFRHPRGCPPVLTSKSTLRPQKHTTALSTPRPAPRKAPISAPRRSPMLRQTGPPCQATKLTETASANRMKRVRPPKAVPQRIGCR